jgi:hypothetical protein
VENSSDADSIIARGYVMVTTAGLAVLFVASPEKYVYLRITLVLFPAMPHLLAQKPSPAELSSL